MLERNLKMRIISLLICLSTNLLVLSSCQNSDSRGLHSLLLEKYDFQPVMTKGSTVYLMIDLNSCGSCLDKIENHLSDPNNFDGLNLVFISKQNKKQISQKLDLESSNVVSIDEIDFVKLNGGYGFYLYFYNESSLLKSIKLNNNNVREYLRLSTEFIEGEYVQ